MTTTATLPALSVRAIAELLLRLGFRVTVSIDDALVAERPVLGTHVLRRVVAQANADGTFRTGYLFARPGQPGGPVYENELVSHESQCRDLEQFVEWLAIQDARLLPAKVGA